MYARSKTIGRTLSSGANDLSKIAVKTPESRSSVSAASSAIDLLRSVRTSEFRKSTSVSCGIVACSSTCEEASTHGALMASLRTERSGSSAL